MSEIRPKVQLFEKELGITPGIHAEIDAELSKTEEKLKNGTLETRPIDELFQRSKKLFEMLEAWEEGKMQE